MMKLASVRKWNFPLIIGAIILVALLIISTYPEKLATADPYGKQRLEFLVEGGKTSFVIPPIPPGEEFPWGTDNKGRDLRSLIIYGCKVTLVTAVLTAIGRLILALPIAIAAANKNRFFIWFIKQFNIIFGALPLVIVVVMLSKLHIISDFLKDGKLAMALPLILFGWSKLAYLLMEKVTEILEQDFVEGETAIGKNKLEIALQNVLPHLIPSLIVLFFMEIALILITMTQVGVFGMLAGGGYYNSEGNVNTSSEFDWASLLIFTYLYFGSDKMYQIIYPAAAFAISIIGFNLFGEGLRIEFEKRNSRVITFIRRLPSFVSPFRLAFEIKNIGVYRRTVYTKLACYILVLGILFFPQPPSLHRFDTAAAFKSIDEVSSDKYRGRLAGSLENKELAQYISKQLQGYGIKPYDSNYIHEFDISSSINVKASSLKLKDSFGREKEFIFRKDYVVTSPVNFSGEFQVATIRVKELINLKQEQKDALTTRGLGSKLLILDLSNVWNDIDLNKALQTIAKYIKPKAIIFIQDLELEHDIPKQIIMNKMFNQSVTIIMNKNAGEELLRLGEGRVEFSVESETLINKKGYNVLGYIPGSEADGKDEFVVIGSKLDYVGDDKLSKYPGTLEAGAVAAELEIAKKLAESGIKPKHNIMFAFWDGAFNESRGSSNFVRKYVDQGKIKSVTYIDIGNIANKESSTVFMDTSRIFPTNMKAQEYIQIIKNNARKQDIKLVYGSLNSPLMIDMTGRKVQSIMLNNEEEEMISTTMRDNAEMLNQKQYKKIGQMLLDTIVEIARGN